MGVRIKTKERITGSFVVPGLNSEASMWVVDVDEDDDYIVEGMIDLSQVQDGDEVEFKSYVAVDGSNWRLLDIYRISGEPQVKVLRIPAMTVPYNGKYKVSVLQTAGSPKSFVYVFWKQVYEVVEEL